MTARRSWTPTEGEIAKALADLRDDADEPSPYYVLGYVDSALKYAATADTMAEAGRNVRQARAMLAAFEQHRTEQRGGA